MGHVEVQRVSVVLPDGRPLLDEVSLRVGEGARMALVGPNGAGKSTLLRIVAGDQVPDSGSVVRSGGLGVMRQFVAPAGQAYDGAAVAGQGPDAGLSGGAASGGTTSGGTSGGLASGGRAAAAGTAATASSDGTGAEHVSSGLPPGATVRDLLLSVSPATLRAAAAALDAAELAMMDADDEPTAMRYAQAIADFADAGGYDAEVRFDVVTTAALGLPFDRVQYREVTTLSGGEQKRLVLETLFRGPDEVLLLDEPDNYLDVAGKRWLEDRLRGTDKTVLFVSHDRELLANAATHVATLEPGAAGATVWVHGGGFGTYRQAREDRLSRLEELRRRWDEQHAKLKALVLLYKTKAAYNDGLASRYQAAQTRLRRFEEAGPPEEPPATQRLRMRLSGGRTGKRAVVAESLALTGLTELFDLEVWYGERVAVLGANGTGKSHLLRLMAAGGTDPDREHRPVEGTPVPPVAHSGVLRLGARVRPGWFVQTHAHPELAGRTLLDVLWRGDEHRDGMPREQAARALDRYGLARAGEQPFETLSGGQQARFQILLLELSGATLLLLDEPTDNLDLESVEALEAGLEAFEGTVVAVTHDRWFARGFDRFLVVGSDGSVRETAEPVWDEAAGVRR